MRNITGINMFAPNYQTPRSVQMNIGFEHQLGKGVVWNADYIRNVGTHTLLAIDVNHVGDVRFFNKSGRRPMLLTAATRVLSCRLPAASSTALSRPEQPLPTSPATAWILVPTLWQRLRLSCMLHSPDKP